MLPVYHTIPLSGIRSLSRGLRSTSVVTLDPSHEDPSIYKDLKKRPMSIKGKGLPRTWREDEEFISAYEEGGQAIGRALMYSPDKEPYFWTLLGGIGLWPRWYLKGFKAMYRSLHPTEVNNLKVRNRRKNKRKRDQRDILEHEREEAIRLIAHPNSKNPQLYDSDDRNVLPPDGIDA